MKGIVVQFRRGRKTVHERHYLLDIGLENREEAKKYAGKEVIWKSPGGKEIKGKISDAHGNKGIVRAIFEKGLPGQAITSDVEVLAGEEKEEKEKKKKEKNVNEKTATGVDGSAEDDAERKVESGKKEEKK